MQPRWCAMTSVKKSLKICLQVSAALAFMGLGASQAHAWGAKGHRIVADAGASLAKGVNPQAEFWYANTDAMKQLSTVPDRVWKNPQTKEGEAPTHWFQADAYVKNQNWNEILAFPSQYSTAVGHYGEGVIVKNGTAPWRIRQLYQEAVNQFKAGNMEKGLQAAGTMSHYIGDLSQPLHDSENYDGQDTGNDGIHAWFETTNIRDEDSIDSVVMTKAQALLENNSFTSQMGGDLMQTILHEVERSIAYRDQVLKNDTELGRGEEAQKVQLKLAEERMADGAATLAIVLAHLSKDASLNSNAVVEVDDPKWIEPDYDGLRSQRTPLRAVHNPAFEDDCGAE